jgi:paraquat-inducible protein B
MTSTASAAFKLGLLALMVLAALTAVGVVLAVRVRRVETVEHHTYFDESVAGLEVGAPVKLRGIDVGAVSRISFAEAGDLVDVTLAIRPDASPRLAWDPAHDNGLRAQTASQGITGVKLVDLDVVDPSTNPPPRLPFAPPLRYVPSSRSLLARLGDGLGRTADRMPELVDTAIEALVRLEGMMARLDERGVPDRLGSTLQNVNLAVSDLRGVMRHIDKEGAPGSGATLDRLDAAIDAFGRVMTRVDGDAGLVASTQRASDAVDQLGRRAAGATEELDKTLRDVGDAARAIRRVADALDRDPDMLLKGRRGPR